MLTSIQASPAKALPGNASNVASQVLQKKGQNWLSELNVSGKEPSRHGNWPSGAPSGQLSEATAVDCAVGDISHAEQSTGCEGNSPKLTCCSHPAGCKQCLSGKQGVRTWGSINAASACCLRLMRHCDRFLDGPAFWMEPNSRFRLHKAFCRYLQCPKRLHHCWTSAAPT